MTGENSKTVNIWREKTKNNYENTLTMVGAKEK